MKKILIVDDEAYIRTLLEQILEELEDEYGVKVLVARDGKECLEIIKKEKPDLVFLDVMMPKMNGYDVCKQIKLDPELKDIKIVFLTAKGQEADKKQGLDFGALKYITKPFDPDEILEETKKLLNLD
ncbi:MAG: response regulator [Thermodesulfobacteria bacterium]|nr:response regulator [Thermodesulfobacteriota bacterium]